MNILSTNSLTKYYGSGPSLVKALDGVTLEIEQGSFTAIVELPVPERVHCFICWVD